MTKEVMQQALEALEINLVFLRNVKPFKGQENLASDCVAMTEEIISTLEEALKQEQDEPVGEAYLCDCCLTPFDGAYECPSCGHNSSTKEPVYTTPQQRKPLTDERIDEMWAQHCVVWKRINKTLINPIVFARAIEAAHGIKE